MIATLLSAGPGVTLQDGGRPGQTGLGLSRGGAADPLALIEARALLGQTAATTVLECAGMGLSLMVDAPTRFAVTGATPAVTIDGQRIETYATHRLSPGQTLTLGPVTGGVYACLAFAGGIDVKPLMGGRGAHLLAGLGAPLAAGDTLTLGADPAPETSPQRLTPNRRQIGPIRVMPGPQTGLFSRAMLERFEATVFTRSPRGNRQGVRMDHDGAGFATEDQLALVSDFISVGDVQMTGDGRPFVLLSEHQTTGGYPRIGNVIPADLPRIAQMEPGKTTQFEVISLKAAQAAFETSEEVLKRLKSRVEPLVRDPRDVDLATLNLIDGVVKGEI